MEAQGGVPVIPMRRNRKIEEPRYTALYIWRNLMERCINRLEHSRLATRYDKTAASFLGFIDIAFRSNQPEPDLGAAPRQ